MLQLNINIAVCRARMEIAAAFINFYVSVDGAQVAERFKILHPQCSVHRVDVLQEDVTWHMHGVFDGDFHAFFRGIPCGNGKAVGTGVHVDRDEIQLGFLVGGGLDRAHLHLIFVPALDTHRSVDVVQLQCAVGLQVVCLREFAGHPVTRGNGKQGNGQKSQTNRTDCGAKLHTASFADNSCNYPRDDRQIRTSDPTLHTSGAES